MPYPAVSSEGLISVVVSASPSPCRLSLPLLFQTLRDVALLGKALPRRVRVGRVLGQLLVALLSQDESKCECWGEGKRGSGIQSKSEASGAACAIKRFPRRTCRFSAALAFLFSTLRLCIVCSCCMNEASVRS